MNDSGRAAERRVRKHLERHGFRILASNFRSSRGEIDLIAFRPGELHFVEVRSRSNDGFMHPLESVDRRKRDRIRATAEAFLARRPDATEEVYFDIAAVVGEKIEYFEDAFE